ncbi:hypothetical protein GCM10008110_22290 [Marinobacter persicus]|nr:hypothetical protein GCM10008110_22290 [Marinobacter persicus]
MRSHVQAIGQQSHRAINDTGQDLPDHHRQRQAHYDECSGFARSLQILTEDVIVLPMVESFMVHNSVPGKAGDWYA